MSTEFSGSLLSTQKEESNMSDNVAPSQKLPLSRVALAGLIAIGASVFVNLVIWWLGSMLVNPPADFVPLASPGPTIIFTVTFLVGATIVYAIINALSKNPARMFTIVATIVLVLGFVPDVMMLIAPESMPMGTPTLGAVLVLITMHFAAFAITLWAFTRWAPRR
jgi:hypothetical protein